MTNRTGDYTPEQIAASFITGKRLHLKAQQEDAWYKEAFRKSQLGLLPEQLLSLKWHRSWGRTW
jgi:hypothetical protein